MHYVEWLSIEISPRLIYMTMHVKYIELMPTLDDK